MTGPMHNDPKMQELAEHNAHMERKMRDVESELRQSEHGIAKLINRMGWTTAEWNRTLDYAENAACEEIAKNLKLERELAETKAALEDALHDAKRWRAIAGAEPSEKVKASNLPDGRDSTEKMARILTVPGWPMLTYIGRDDRSIYIRFEGPAYGYVPESSLQWILDESIRQRELREGAE